MKRVAAVCLLAAPAWIGIEIRAVGAEPIEAKGKVDAVTVYRGQAYVTRIVDLPGPEGLREVVVTELPDRIVPESLYAESADGVEVRSVRYRVRPVQEDVREEVRLLDQKLRGVQEQLDANQRLQMLLAEKKAFLITLEQFTAPTADLELDHGVLNAETIKSLTRFLFDERGQLANEDLKLQKEKKTLDEQKDLLGRERNTLTGASARTVREAVVFVNLAAPTGGRLRVRYLVDQAGWTPSYTVRADDTRRQIVLDYMAAIQQMSGEEWEDVEMTLSTATPSLVSKAPMLDPLSVTLTSAAVSSGFQEAKDALSLKKSEFERARAQRRLPPSASPSPQQQQQAAGGKSGYRDEEVLALLNQAAGDLQVLDLVTNERVSRRNKSERGRAEEGVSVTYAIHSRTTLPSRSDRQLIQIASRPMKAEFYRLAAPVLTEYVYDEALATNDSQLVLLAGPVSSYVAGRFVGQGELPLVSVGENFTVGFGIDPTLRASRELVEKSDAYQGGNRVTTFTYRIALENFAGYEVAVRVLDRLPHAENSEMRLELIEDGPDISTDPEYLQVQRAKGILRWDVDVPGQVFGSKAFAFEYQFRVEYDKQMTLTTATQ